MKKFHIDIILLLWCVILTAHFGDCALIRTFIVGGTTATSATQFPYQVSLRRYNSHICGAAIISTNYILTAAHCVTQEDVPPIVVFSANELSVRVGSTRVNTGGRVISIEKVTVHNQYAFPINDIALLRVQSAISYTSSIQAIPLASSALSTNTTLVASGWGFTSTNGLLPTELQFVQLTFVANTECNRIYGQITPSLVCLQSPQGQGICQGDSGGPAANDGKLYGVASFTPDVCGGKYPDGFTNVYNFRSWITLNSDVTL